MKTSNNFPEGLLNGTNKARGDFFQSKIIAHPNLVSVMNQVVNEVFSSTRYPIIIVYGATGAGKSTLARRLRNEVIIRSADLYGDNPGCIPAILNEAKLAGKAPFSSKGHWLNTLVHLNDPIENKTDYSSPTNNQGTTKKQRYKGNTELAYYEAYLNALNDRGTLLHINDEAQKMRKVATEEERERFMEALTAIGNCTNAVFMMIGTYELTDLIDQSEQLFRRSLKIPFLRYRINAPKIEEREMAEIHFRSVLQTFQTLLPLNRQPDLVDDWEYYYSRSLGLIGVLKTWLDRSLVKTLETENQRWTKKITDAESIKLKDLNKLYDKLDETEKQFVDDDVDEDLFRRKIGLDQPASGKKDSAAKKKRKGFPKRKPNRIPVAQ